MSDGGGGDDSGGEEEGSAEDVEAEKAGSMAGWAEAMAKILGKETSKSCSKILVQNKELSKIKEEERKLKLEKKKQVQRSVCVCLRAVQYIPHLHHQNNSLGIRNMTKN